MLTNIEQKNLLLWLREQSLKLMVTSLRMFKETEKEEFHNFAKWFGNQSKELAEEIKKS